MSIITFGYGPKGAGPIAKGYGFVVPADTGDPAFLSIDIGRDVIITSEVSAMDVLLQEEIGTEVSLLLNLSHPSALDIKIDSDVSLSLDKISTDVVLTSEIVGE